MDDVGTTKRGSMSPQRRLRIWEAHGGQCVICGAPIDGTKEKWIVEHVRSLGLGGADKDANCGPAHATCADVKTKDDMQRITKAKRVKAKSIGIKKQSSFQKRDGYKFNWKTGRYEKVLA